MVQNQPNDAKPLLSFLLTVRPKGGKSIRQKLESFSKEKKDCSPQTFGIPLSQVIANDRAHRQLQEAVRSSRRLCLEVEATVRRFRAQRHQRTGMGRSPVPCSALPEESQSDGTTSAPLQGAMSVDSIADLSDNTSKLLEALQLSHPHELGPRRSPGKKKMLSLNPITWQVPRIVDRCCKHIETHGKYSGPTGTTLTGRSFCLRAHLNLPSGRLKPFPLSCPYRPLSLW
uniref:Uncharacterized protein n=1 Tax=Strigops habroptila TaxID=2489341 RepID=A0A672USP7_STRHB